ncbi:polysaccharide deacetylase [Klebsiella michiganensis]|uniref:Polysaccharide deacetylase n=1 Tax=Klebsiella michiganensis TaxID=1134687 RepID=A0A7H4N1Y8_9ENTR|nr:polysaccharide deacetylase [Klebsiella michiganensis]
MLHGDAGSEQFLSDIIGAASYPDRHMSMDSLYEYGSRAGFWRIHNEFSQRGLPLTVFWRRHGAGASSRGGRGD